MGSNFVTWLEVSQFTICSQILIHRNYSSLQMLAKHPRFSLSSLIISFNPPESHEKSRELLFLSQRCLIQGVSYKLHVFCSVKKKPLKRIG